MQKIKIFVTGVQYGDPINFIEFLENQFNVQRKIREVNCKKVENPYIGFERVNCVEIENYRAKNLDVRSTDSVVYYDEELHKIMLENCDGILVILTSLKIRNQANLARLNQLNYMLENLAKKIPVVIAFNRFNADLLDANETLSSNEINETVSNNYPALITNFGISFEKTTGSNESSVRIEGGFEALDCLLDLIDKDFKEI